MADLLELGGVQGIRVADFAGLRGGGDLLGHGVEGLSEGGAVLVDEAGGRVLEDLTGHRRHTLESRDEVGPATGCEEGSDLRVVGEDSGMLHGHQGFPASSGEVLPGLGEQTKGFVRAGGEPVDGVKEKVRGEADRGTLIPLGENATFLEDGSRGVPHRLQDVAETRVPRVVEAVLGGSDVTF